MPRIPPTVTEQALLARLLIPGWAGLLTIIEAEYIASQLAVDAKLRRAWGYRRQKRYTLQSIAEKAFPQDPDEGRRVMENLLGVQAARRTRTGSPNLDKKRVVRVSDAPTAPAQMTFVVVLGE